MTARDAQAIADAIEHCRRLTRQRARNFYYGLKLAPEPKRSALYVVYAWMRRADDLADAVAGDSPGALRRIEAFRAATDGAMAGRPDESDPVLVALADMADRFHLRPDDLHAMLDGQVDDLTVRRYETFDQLKQYCQRVASTVGEVCVDVWGYSDRAAHELAVQRGIAFQLTNILRDFAEDYGRGRIYLPQEDFDRVGVSAAQLRQWQPAKACSEFVAEQVRRAESFYQDSAGLDGMITASCRPTLWAMTTIYRELLARIARDPARIALGPRVRVPAWRKAAIAMRARRMARDAASVPDAVGGPAPR